jgi:DNA-binding GntR family transcriptional regulator
MSTASPAFSLNDDESSAAPREPLALDMRFDGLPPRTAQQLVYEVVRRSIMRGQLTPGTHLTQTQLADQLEISTTPVREALRRLAGEGLVKIDAHRGAIVRGLNRDELMEIYELRLLLEPLAIRKAAERITDEELARAEALWERMNDHSDVGAWSEVNRDFHAIFAGAARSPLLIQILEGLRDSAAPYVRWSISVHPGFSVTANEEHQALMDACRARDGERAAAIEETHLRATLAAVLDQPVE